MTSSLPPSLPLFLLGALCFLSLAMLVWFALQFGVSSWQRYASRFTESTEYRLSGLFLFADSRKLLAAYSVCLVAAPGLVFLLFDSLALVGVLLAVLMVTPKLLLARLELQRSKAIDEALPDVLAQIAGGMQAGSTLTTAIEAVTRDNAGPIGQELSLLLGEQKLGVRLEDALDNLAERTQSEAVDLVVAAALIAHDVGGNLSEIFQRLSVTLRKKLEMEGKIKSLTAQGVLQGWVVSLLPFAILVVLWFIETDAVSRIYTSVLGWLFLGTILFLQLLGALMIRKIVNIDI